MGTLDIIVEANATSLRCWQRASSSSIQEDWLNVIETAKAVMVSPRSSLLCCGAIRRLMPKPYSYELRQKFISAIKLDGLKIDEASILFNISCNMISLWLKRQNQTGDFLPLPNKPPGNGHKIIDWEKFREFAKMDGDKTRWRWLNSGMGKLAHAQSHEP